MTEAGGFRYPPSGVPSQPIPDRPYMALKDAARLMHLDRRTLHAMLISGRIEGWARPGPHRLRWYVYEDQLTPKVDAGVATEIAELRSEVAELRAELAQISHDTEAVADLRAQIVSLTESNLLLLDAQEDLGKVALTMDGVAQKYRQALGLFLTPGHPGPLTTP